MEFHFPYGLKPSRVEERKEFYSNEFNLEKAKEWFETGEDYLALSIDVGTETTRYKPRFKKYLNKLVYIRKFKDIEGLRKKLIHYSPEDLYYSQKEFRDGSPRKSSELLFDIDPENIKCKTCKLRKKKYKEGVKTFCEDCAEKAAEKTIQLYELMKRNFENVRIIFSGRGYHIHVRDKEAMKMSKEDKKKLAEKVKKEFPIDPWVTEEKKDLIRLPQSLNGLVSRKVIEVSKSDLRDPKSIYKEKALPKFLE